MLRLYIGNKTYSSWSLRGWLALMQSGLPFEEVIVPLYDEAWVQRRNGPEFAPANGKVPILWDGETAVWDSLAILDWLDRKTGGTRYWPADDAAHALARSMAAEMHSGFQALRGQYSMNLRARHNGLVPDTAVSADIARITHLWREARTRFGAAAGGDFLFGAFGAADILFAPVVTRLDTYGLPVPADARPYMDAMLSHPFMARWIAEAAQEPWVIERFERFGPAAL
jgi:glutathione S-transferase